MTVLFSLLLLIAQLFTATSYLNAFEWNDPFPKNRKGGVLECSHNGLITYIQENRAVAQCGSIRIVVKKEPLKSEVLVFEMTPENHGELEPFFSSCKQRLSLKEQSVAVVAVGDFAGNDMRAFCQEQFASFTFSDPTFFARKEPFVLSPANSDDIAFSIDYSSYPQPICSVGDLYQRWIDIVLENILQKKLKQKAQETGFAFSYLKSDSFYPADSCLIHVSSANKNYLKVLFVLLEELEKIKQNGYSEEDVAEIKQQLIAMLEHHRINRVSEPNVELAAYYADQILYQNESPDFDLFLKLSARLISYISKEDLILRSNQYLDDNHRLVKIFYPAQKQGVVSERDIDKILARFQQAPRDTNSTTHLAHDGDVVSDLLSEDIPVLVVNQPEETPSYFQLPLVDNEKKIIAKIITTMSDKNVVQLTFEKKGLEKKGKQIDHVHPLRFIGYVFSEPRLKASMKIIRRSIFKWNGFLDGFSRRMKEEYHNDNLLPHVPGLCYSLGIPTDEVTHYIEHRDWEGLVRYLISN